MRVRAVFLAAVLLGLVCGPGCGGERDGFTVPVEYHKLDNGLKVVLSPDHTAPVVVVAVYYKIGFRIEPRNRTGFAHLFEHMMFQGTENLPKGEFNKLIYNQGGVNNGSTRFDFTNYYEVVPSHVLEPVLWAEADRMRGLDLSQESLTNQQGVVVNEINQALHNQPYGGFPWLDMPQLANENWYNAHNFYGDLEDVKAATLEDVKAFFKTFYAPNNAAMVLAGDFEPDEALAMIEKYFGDVPAAEMPPPPDLTEPRQEAEKVSSKDDSLATRPALAFAYHMPPRGTPEYYAMGLLDQVLVQGEDSRLYQALVKREALTGDVWGGINMLLGNMFNYHGPMLFSAFLYYDSSTSSQTVMSAVDEVVEGVRTEMIDEETLDRALVKIRSDIYGNMDDFFGFGRADMMACLALYYDAPEKINKIEDEFGAVTPELILETAKEYLRPTNRTVLTINPKAGS